MQVDIYMPRMDVMFKEGPVPKERGPIAPIRQHWIKFIDILIGFLIKANNNDIIII